MLELLRNQQKNFHAAKQPGPKQQADPPDHRDHSGSPSSVRNKSWCLSPFGAYETAVPASGYTQSIQTQGMLQKNPAHQFALLRFVSDLGLRW